MSLERDGFFQPVVADRAFGFSPHHTQAFARAQRRRHHQAARRRHAARQLVVIGAGERQRQQNAGAFVRGNRAGFSAASFMRYTLNRDSLWSIHDLP